MLKTLSEPKFVSASGLSIFRIFFFSIQLLEVCQIYYFKEFIFDRVPFLDPVQTNYQILLLVWIFALIAIILGFKTKYFLIINYIFSILLIALGQKFEYHVDYSYAMVNFISIFLPLNLCYSLDSILDKNINSHKVNYFYHLFIVYSTIAITYIDSVFRKISCVSWKSGLGMWLPASLPQFTWLDLSCILDQKEIVIAFGYFVLVFELLFIFLMWN